MGRFFSQMGIFLYPLLLSTLFLFIQVVRAGMATGSGDPARKAGANKAVLAWGGLTGVLGILGTLVGFSLAAGALEGASAISPQVVWGGVKVALSTSIFGLLVLTLSLVVWMVMGYLGARVGEDAG